MKCPKCGDILSTATKVCPRCGYIADDRIGEYLSSLEGNLRELKSLPSVSFGDYFSRNSYVLYAFVTVVFVIVMFMTDAGLFLILSCITLIMLVASLVRKISIRRRNAESDSRYRQLKVDTETIMRTLRSDYGESLKVRDQLRDASSQLKDIDYEYNANRRHAVRVWLAVIVLTVAVSVAGIVFLGMRDSSAETATDLSTENIVSYKE